MVELEVPPRPAGAGLEQFEHVTDGTLVRLTCQTAPSLAEMQHAIAGVLLEMSAEPDWSKLVGPAEGRSFSLRFSGVAGLAARRAGNLFGVAEVGLGLLAVAHGA